MPALPTWIHYAASCGTQSRVSSSSVFAHVPFYAGTRRHEWEYNISIGYSARLVQCRDEIKRQQILLCSLSAAYMLGTLLSLCCGCMRFQCCGLLSSIALHGVPTGIRVSCVLLGLAASPQEVVNRVPGHRRTFFVAWLELADAVDQAPGPKQGIVWQPDNNCTVDRDASISYQHISSSRSLSGTNTACRTYSCSFTEAAGRLRGGIHCNQLRSLTCRLF